MNELKKADEIVKALRWLAKDTEFVFAAENLNDAADALEAADKRAKELEAAQRWIPCAEGK